MQLNYLDLLFAAQDRKARQVDNLSAYKGAPPCLLRTKR